MRIYLQYNNPEEEQKPRYYQICLQPDLLGGWNVVKEWGHQGSPGRVMSEHHQTIEDAQSAIFKTRDQQIKRGYKVMFVQGDKRS